jgi:hypothetical protein
VAEASENKREEVHATTSGVGFGIIALVAVIILAVVAGLAGPWAIQQWRGVWAPPPPIPPPPPTLLLSAYRERAGQVSILNISGQVLVKGKPVEDGRVKLTIDRETLGLNETFVLNVEKGGFKAGEPPISVAPDERVRVSVEAWSPAFEGSAQSSPRCTHCTPGG